MLRVRIAGPRARLEDTLATLQDLGILHIDPPRIRASAPSQDETSARERRHLDRCLRDVEAALAILPVPANTGAGAATTVTPGQVRRARRVRRRAEALTAARAALDDERSVLLRYREFFRVFESLVDRELAWPDGQAFYVVLRPGAGNSLAELRHGLDAAAGGEVELLARELSSGEQAVLLLASPAAAPRVSALLAAARVDELPAPSGLGETSLLRAMPAIKARLEEIPREQQALLMELKALTRLEGPWLIALRAVLRDGLARTEARSNVYAARHLFIVEGWLPAPRLSELEQGVERSLGSDVVVSTIGAEDWGAADAPVSLHNPPILQPFEVLTSLLPLPRYGTIDPTPFMAVFFPALFGIMLGDVGYGVLLALLAWLLRVRSVPGSTLRAVSLIGLACASATVVFGLIFGELFGSLGHVVGLRPLVDREHATIPFLVFAIALGGVHILLGLVLAGITAWRRGHRREAMGRSVTVGMLVLSALLLLTALDVLPARLFTPFAVATFAGFIVLVALEGLVSVIELLSTFGRILSYARIMAIGTASLMLAVVANEISGALGSALVGVIFALLFHIVNFAIGLFSPAIHALRLHYVEFFGQFFSPGGAAYRPLAHWRPSS